MPIIRPISDLRNHADRISDRCHKWREPVFITKKRVKISIPFLTTSGCFGAPRPRIFWMLLTEPLGGSRFSRAAARWRTTRN